MFPGCKMAASTVYKHSVMVVAILHPGVHMLSSGSFVTMYLAELYFGNRYMEIGVFISSLHALLGSRLWVGIHCTIVLVAQSCNCP